MATSTKHKPVSSIGKGSQHQVISITQRKPGNEGRAFGASKIPVPTPSKKLESRLRKPKQKSQTEQSSTKKRTYVLDTNVLMHDPSCLFHFKEHDVVIPFRVLDELDDHKKGNEDINRNVRQVSRTIDVMFAGPGTDITSGVSLATISNNQATGRLSIQAEISFEKGTKADHVILEVVKRLKASSPDREVVLVSKDINMRLKARTMGLLTEDYRTDIVEAAKDGDYLHSGYKVMPKDFWETHAADLEAHHKGDAVEYIVHGRDAKKLELNQFILSEGKGGTKPFAARVISKEGNSAVLRTIKNYVTVHEVYKVKARNHEQNFALNLLMDKDVHCVSLAGTAGTGKTILALAAGLQQVFEEKHYREIIFTRATVSIGDEIGFLPGNEQEKMDPWLGALHDNLSALNNSDTQEKDSKHGSDWGKHATEEFIRSRVTICSISFIRGRTFTNKYIIIDEAQNLTPKQAKTLVTRAGKGTKIILMGNLAQIDTPYLTEGSCGLTHVVTRFKDQSRTGHITLVKGERSELADLANEVL